jgi:hypothetical protein
VTKNPVGVTIYRIDVEAAEQFVNQHMKEKQRQMKLKEVKAKKV